MKDKPLTTGEIADYCHVTYRAVLKWIANGKLKAYRTPGNHSRVKVEDFLTFLHQFNMPVPEAFRSFHLRKKVLIVDDDRNLVKALIRTLRADNKVDIDFAYDGFDAGRKLLEFNPDLVILDIRMPGMDGYEVAKRIKDHSKDIDVKIVAMSAFFEEDGKERIMNIGASCCLDKPFNPEELLGIIKDLLQLEIVK